MIVKDKNKLRPKTKSKILVLGLILAILVGLFSPMLKAQAQTPTPPTTGNCRITIVDNNTTPPKVSETTETNLTFTACTAKESVPRPPGIGMQTYWVAGSATIAPSPEITNAQPQGNPDFYNSLPPCFISDGFEGTIEGCLLRLVYALLYTLPAALLYLTSALFNALLSITLSSVLYTKSAFIPEAWKIIRDFSNIFFILILLYISIKMILGLGGTEIKKMIAQVVIVALLINFSMFFTQVVIDSSNILALIFSNKIDVERRGATSPRHYQTTFDVIGAKEKDFAGGIVDAFDPTRLVSPETFRNKQGDSNFVYSSINFAWNYSTFGIIAKTFGASGDPIAVTGPSVSFYLTVMFVTGIIFSVAAYAFFIGALAFLGRLIELWILIIFSPFAFLSLTVPKLKGIDYLGWDSWLKRLLTVAFMAPIFMFFMLIISKLIKADMFSAFESKDIGAAKVFVLVAIPAIINVTLLLKATEFAKKASGEFTGMIIKGTKIATGIVGGLALGGIGLAGQATLGRAGSAIANSARVKRWQSQGKFGATTLGNISRYAAGSSFDARKGVAGSILTATRGITGINLGTVLARDGGFEADRKRSVAKRQKRAAELKVGEDEELTQNLHRLEIDQQELLRASSHEIELIDARLRGAKENANDLNARVRAMDTTDPTLVAARKARIAAAAALPDTDPTKAAQLESAKAMDVDDITKVDAKRKATVAANKANDTVEELKLQKKTIKNANAANATTLSAAVTTAEAAEAMARAAAVADPTNAEKAGEVERATNAVSAARVAAEVANISARTRSGRSINELGDTYIPHARHEIDKENKTRQWNYANNIPGFVPWGRIIRRGIGIQPLFYGSGDTHMSREEARHKIRMGAKIESSDGGGGGHGNFAGHVASDIVGSSIANLFSSHGHDGKKS